MAEVYQFYERKDECFEKMGCKNFPLSLSNNLRHTCYRTFRTIFVYIHCHFFLNLSFGNLVSTTRRQNAQFYWVVRGSQMWSTPSLPPQYFCIIWLISRVNPLALENSGRFLPLHKWEIRTACKQAGSWKLERSVDLYSSTQDIKKEKKMNWFPYFVLS